MFFINLSFFNFIKGANVLMEIPHVGTMSIKNAVIGVKFHNHLQEDTRTVLTR